MDKGVSLLEIYKIEHVNGITKIRFKKRPTYSEVASIIDDIAEHFPYEKRLWDLSGSDFDFTMKEIQDIAEYGKTKFVKQNIIALVAPNDLAYGEMRAFAVYREQEGHSVPGVFRTAPEAMNWLENQNI